MMKKKTILLASSVVAVPVTATIVALLIRKRKLKSPEANITSFPQMSSKGNYFNTATAATISRQQKEESFIERENNQEESKPTEVPTAMKATLATTTASIISSNRSNEDRDLAPSADLVVVPSPSESYSFQTPLVEEISVSNETRKSGESLKDLIVEAIKDAKDSAKETGKRLKQQKTVDIEATVDSRDTQYLKDHTNTLVKIFETVMTEIRKEPYDKQVKLLERYRDLLQIQRIVVNARGRMASKLKPGS